MNIYHSNLYIHRSIFPHRVCMCIELNVSLFSFNHLHLGLSNIKQGVRLFSAC